MLYTVLPTEQPLEAFFKSLEFSLQPHFSWLSSMPLHVYMTTYLSIHVLLDICVGYLFFFFCYFQIVLQSYLQETISSYTLTIFPKERNT